jgi:hypothetical protein
MNQIRNGWAQIRAGLRDGASNLNREYGATFLKNFKISLGVVSIITGVFLISWGIFNLVSLVSTPFGVAIMLAYICLIMSVFITVVERHL